MKNLIYSSFLALVFLFITPNLATSQSSNAFYVELLGNGLIFSANYDMRVQKTEDGNGWGVRAGIGYIDIDGESIVTVPLMVNNLLGKDGKYFEIGAGVTILSANSNFFDDSESTVFGTLSFMYRRQPVDGGFMWKIGLTPVFNSNGFIPYYPGIGLGYSW